ncbi:MAG: zinc-ribbon domain-containing protein, partial [Lancefieldella rimae]
MHCPNCGAENPDGSKFCTSCGTKLSEISEGGNADSLNTALDTSEQTSHLKHAATPEQTISQPAPEPEPQQAAEPTMYMPPVIPAPTSTVTTPIDDTAPQSRQTYADPTQFQVVSEGAASPTPHKKRSSHKAFKIVAIILLTIVLGAGIGIGAWAWNSNQKNNARKDEVVKLEDSYKSQVDAIEVNPTSESDRSALLDSYKQ